MSIRTKLIATFSLMIALIVSLGIFVLVQLSTMNQSAERLASEALPTISQAANLKESLVAYHTAQIRLLSEPDAAQGARQHELLREYEARIPAQIEELAGTLGDGAQRQSYDAFVAAWATYVGRFGLAVLGTNVATAYPQSMTLALTGEFDTLIDAMNRLSAAARARAGTTLDEARSAYDTARSMTLALMTIITMIGAVIGFSQALDLSEGLRGLQRATRRIAAGDLTHKVEIDSDDELGALATDVTNLSSSLRAEQAAVAAQQQALTERNAELEQAYRSIAATIRERETLDATVRALTMPVIPVFAGVLVCPLVGVMDAERAAQFELRVLEALQARGARSVIVDVTGLAMFDADVARLLLRTAAGARLLGARTVLAGIRPELAQTLVGLGVSLEGLATRADLQQAVSYVLGQG